MKQVSSILRYAGGKHRLTPWINSFVRPHKIWIDGMCGGLSVTLGYEGPNRLEFCNDIFPHLINFYKMVQLDVKYVVSSIKVISKGDYSQEVFDSCVDWNASLDENPLMPMAAKFFIRNRMSRDGMFEEYTESPRERRGMPEMQSSFLSALDSLEEFGARIKGIAFLNINILELIDYYKDHEGCVIYLDPPYLHSKTTKRKTGDLYQFEVNEAFHIELLNLVRDAKCQIIISGYDEPLYREMLPSFAVHLKEVPLAMGGATTKKNKRVEALFING